MRTAIAVLTLAACLLLANSASAVGPSCATGANLKYTGDAWPQGTTISYTVIRSSLPLNDPEDTGAGKTRLQDRFIARIRDGARTWNSGKNDCHYKPLHGFATAISGDSGFTGANNNDNHNTIDFASGFSCNGTQGAMLNACTNTRTSGSTTDYSSRSRQKIVEFDMRFNGDPAVRSWYAGVGTTPCGGCFDLWSIASHEWGHVAGVDHPGHTANNRWQTMYDTTNSGEIYPRTLGRSDWLGLHRLYGP
jgi:hypothetical protein